MTIFEMTILDDINYSDFSADNKNRRNQDQVWLSDICPVKWPSL